jgi:hypothetical protein
MEYFDEINSAKSLFLLDIKEPRDNQLSIRVQESTLSDQEEFVPVGDKSIGPVRKIIANDKCRKYKLFFRSYAAYIIINESFPLWHDYEEWSGKLLRIYTKSNYLNYIRKDTTAEEFYDYHNKELKHYSINCENHVIHIACMEEPLVTQI